MVRLNSGGADGTAAVDQRRIELMTELEQRIPVSLCGFVGSNYQGTDCLMRIA